MGPIHSRIVGYERRRERSKSRGSWGWMEEGHSRVRERGEPSRRRMPPKRNPVRILSSSRMNRARPVGETRLPQSSRRDFFRSMASTMGSTARE